MRRFFLPLVTAVGLILSSAAGAQTPAAVTATCKDGTAFSGTTRSGACRGHKGVQAWGDAASTTPAPSPASTPNAAPPSAAATSAPASTAKPRGAPGAGQVWVNTNSKVYHCPGDRWYGKTKAGEYMPEAQAKSSGFRADHNKACPS
jgi:hypothetical protein